MKKEELKPCDLAHLEDKVIAIADAFEKAKDLDRSDEYRKFYIKRAESLTETLRIDFRYYFDKYLIGGIEPYGLSEYKDALN